MTEAERIGQDAEKYSNFRASTDRFKKIKRNSYIAGATAEHERLQQQSYDQCEIISHLEQQLKEKDEWIRKTSEAIDNAWGAYNMSEDKLKSVQELNRELVEALNNYTGMASEYLTKADFDYIDTLNKKAK